MNLYTIGDLHLSFASNKRMDVFVGWGNYEQRIAQNWLNKINDDDLIVVLGDVSWGMNLNECLDDFEFINNLRGKKILVKGNHDYWWGSLRKIKFFFEQNKFTTLEMLHNNAFKYNNMALCGSRGWPMIECTQEINQKVMKREAMRLERSIKAGVKLNAEEIIVFLHYPPIYKNLETNVILEVLDKYKTFIKRCYYGHLHGDMIKKAFIGKYNEIEFQLVSADAINFNPLKII